MQSKTWKLDRRNQAAFGLALVFALASASCAKNAATGAPSVVDGTWATACQANGSGGGVPNAVASKSTVVYGSGNYTYTQVNYSDAACTTAVLTQTEAGTFTVGSAETTPAGSTDIGYVQSANTATPATAAEATALNTAVSGSSICTIGGTPVTFSSGTATSIAGATCGGGGSSGAQTTNGSAILNVFILTATATPNTLQFGNSTGNENLGVVSPGARPTTMNTTNTYSKQ